MIIDTHIHLYDPTRPQGVPWLSPDDEVLYRKVFPEDYKALAIPEGVTGTVVVEASEWVEDNQWILDIAADEPFIVGFVGNLQPGSEDFAVTVTPAENSGLPVSVTPSCGGGGSVQASPAAQKRRVTRATEHPRPDRSSDGLPLHRGAPSGRDAVRCSFMKY